MTLECINILEFINIVVVFILSIFFTGILIPQILLISFRRNLFDEPDDRDIKRTVRKFGLPKGHRKGAYGTELLDYFEARMQIYLPTYKWVLDNIPDVHHIVERIKEQSRIQDIVLLDYNTNVDFRDASKPLSHAGLLKLYIEGNYPQSADGYTPMTAEELDLKKQLSKELKKEIRKKAKAFKEQQNTLFDNNE